MDDLIILGLIAGVAVATSMFLATYFLAKSKNKPQDKLLGLLFLAISLRLSKSISFFIFHSIAPIGLAIGFLGLSAIGPLLYLYIRSSSEHANMFQNSDWFHAVVPIAGAMACLFLNLYPTTLLYWGTTALLFIYLVFSVYRFIQNQYTVVRLRQWNLRILIVVCLIWGAFVYQHVTSGIPDYAIGSGIAAVPIYYIFIYALRWPITNAKAAAKKLPLDCLQNIQHAFEKEAVFLNKGVSLSKFSEELNIPAYLITNAVKELYGKTFPETVNHFRIEALKRKLQDPDTYNTKIEALAYEVGFNSPSVFYSEFKKSTGVSPSKYKANFHSTKA
ncbi:AraC family transcriptional regulator [Muricauda sp. 2012CJ35-5]|uniref:AraC family transcriptional regulator n=1 Tax=Flagellimonas spongiicola TaxID=2942208 RepID=A0ABT0PVL1_9FLAO|nr:AraC family transcriptional regulator [Allomuricauda spongiicola]MCL6274747.1 AraC family transcriptional regulator [Allomuricauda spongiicola]